MLIRNAHPDEADCLTSIAFASKAFWQYSTAQMEAWREQLRITSSYVAANFAFVAEFDAQPGGFIAMVAQPGHWQLDHLWILPKYMRQGAGRALMGHVMARARERGIAEIAIDAEPFAERFYRSCGARRVGEVAAPIDTDTTRVRPQLVIAL